MMKQNARVFKVILRFSALFCFFLSPFPVFSLIVQKVKLPAVYYLYSVLMLELCGFFGFGLRALLESMRRIRSFLISILLVLFGIVFSFGACLAFASLGIHPVYIVILTVTVGILYIFSVRMISHAYDEILTRNWFLFSSGFNIFCLLVAHFTVAEFSAEPMLIVYICCVALFAVILNQRGIDVVMDRRGHSASQLPPKIRYYNMILVGIILTIALLLIIFRTPVVNGAKAAFSAVGGVVLKFLGWFGGLFALEKQPEVELDSVPSDIDEDFTAIGESGDPLVSRIAVIVILALIVLISIRPVYRKLRSLVSRIVLAIKKWLHRERIFRGRSFDENEYYTDTNETVEHDGKAIQDLSPSRALRAWKREIKSFQKMPNSKEKLTIGYHLACRGLELHGYKIEPGDTQLDILKKARERLSGEAFETATWCYDALVFGGYEDDLKLKEMEQSLLGIRALPAAKK